MTNLSFHPDAAKRFDDLADEIVHSVRLLPNVQERPKVDRELHAVAHITEADIIGDVRLTERIVDGTGSEVGRVWKLNNKTFGWAGSDFQKLKLLARKIAGSNPYVNLVSSDFVLNAIFEWSKRAVERSNSKPLHAFLETLCNEAIRPYEIWIPLFCTYSSSTFQIGDVTFRTVTKEIMESSFSRISNQIAGDPAAVVAINRQRSRIQGSLAGCVSVNAEYGKAVSSARDKVEEATALLRFLSPANWTWKMRSYSVPLGLENVERRTEISVSQGKIENLHDSVVPHGPLVWNIDEVLSSLRENPIPKLHALSSTRNSQFQGDLYNALLIYSRNSIATDISDKLLFVLVALESMLLKDPNEPLQKNIGERMAFLVGDSAQSRKGIANTVEEVYRIRSQYIHHGAEVRGEDALQKFLYHAWDVFRALLSVADKFQTRAALFVALEDRKFS